MNLDRYQNLVNYSTTLASKLTGNVYSQSNAQMVVSRLKRRMLELKIEEPDEYLSFLKNNIEDEKDVLIGLLTTHHTFFFREFVHFEFLKTALPELVRRVKAEGRSTLKVWSAAASRGHEAVSLSLFLGHYIQALNLNIDYEIWGTDVDPESIRFARKGLYPYQDVKEIPSVFLHGKWQKGNVAGKTVAKVREVFSEKCKYGVDNLLELKTQDKFDLILCRNVLIYFDADNVKKILNGLTERLHKNGLLITGVSEPVGHLQPGMQGIGPCVYTRGGMKAPEVPEVQKRRIRVVNVDDSKSVLKVLKKIFTDNSNYELVGQVENGEELYEFLQKNQVDVVTLDLHMPVLGGVEYLEKYYKSGHPAVVVVSSVNRDNEELGKRAVELGAVDYIEKPNLQNFEKCSEEMTNKIQTIVKLGEVASTPKLEVKPSAVAKTTTAPMADVHQISKKVKQINLILFCSAKEHYKVNLVLKELVSYGLFPKAIVLPYLEHKEQWTAVFNGLNISHRLYQNDFLCGISTFLSKYNKDLLQDKYTLCFYESSELIDSLTSAHVKNNYILSEARPKTHMMKVNIMPSPSWAYHIHETYSEDGLNREVWMQASVCPNKSGHIVSQGEVLVLGYNNQDKLTDVFITKSIPSRLPTVAGFKIIGSKKNIDRVAVAIENARGTVLKKIVRNDEYVFKVANGTVSLSLAPKKVTTNPLGFKGPESIGRKFKVMVIDDSLTIGKILKKVFDESKNCECIDVVTDPTLVGERLKENRPDVVTLDVNMPKMNGVEVYQKFLRPLGIPTIVVSSSLEENDDVLQLLNDGAVDYIQKPGLSQMDSKNFPLCQKIELACSAKVQTRAKNFNVTRLAPIHEKNSLIVIGSSTGGTRALHQILASFPTSFPPVVIAQHIPAGFSNSFAKQLNNTNPFEVVEARDGEKLRDNCIFIAPGSRNIVMKKEGNDYVLRVLDARESEHGIPSVNQLFSSVAQCFEGKMVGIVLTGMGKDGAIGLLEMKKKGAITIAQDEESSVVYGMPRAAMENGAADTIVSLDDVAKTIMGSFKRKAA